MVGANHVGRCVLLCNVLSKFLIKKNLHILSLILDPMVGVDHRGKCITICENLNNSLVDGYS